MSTWAVLAAKQAAIATGFGAGLVPAIGTGPLDGFVIGAAITGACFTALTASGRARRRAALTAAAGVTASAACLPDATSAAGTPAMAGGGPDADSARAALLRRYFAAAEQFEPDWERPSAAAGHAPGQDQGTRARTVTAMTGPRTARAGAVTRAGIAWGTAARSGAPGWRPAAPRPSTRPLRPASSARLTGMFAGRAVLSAARHCSLPGH